MAMNGDVLGTAIVARINALLGTNPTPDPTAFWREVGSAIVSHIQGSAVVTVASVTLVTPGLQASGPGAGTIL